MTLLLLLSRPPDRLEEEEEEEPIDEASNQPSKTVVDSDAKYGEDLKSSYGAKRDTIYMEIEIEQGDEAWGTENETEKEAKSDHQNHKHIERKIYDPSTQVNFFKIWLRNVTFIWVFLLDRFRFDLFLFQVFKTQNDWEFRGIQR